LLCHNPELQQMFVAKGYEIVRCGQCGFCQVARPPADAELARLYADLHVSHTRFRDEQAPQRENQTRLRLVQEFVGPPARILDAGCATGDFLALAKAIYTVYGVDISSGAIAQAQARLPDIADRLRAVKLEEIGEHWPVFDAICLWDVIEHVRDPVGVCRTLLRLLKPGGYLFLSTPDMGALTARLMRQHWAFMIPPLHLGFFSRASFAYLFASQLPARILTCRTQGKWTSVAFLFYKLNQISRWLAPAGLLDWLSRSRLGRINLYVPTNDIIYLVSQKPEQ
jgi:2-polyprenyl-3-methyl-5-hydroxy-6-metoxy-1,4-benzoquinol methylase